MLSTKIIQDNAESAIAIATEMHSVSEYLSGNRFSKGLGHLLFVEVCAGDIGCYLRNGIEAAGCINLQAFSKELDVSAPRRLRSGTDLSLLDRGDAVFEQSHMASPGGGMEPDAASTAAAGIVAA